MPGPEIPLEPETRFRNALNQGRLELQRCSQCQVWLWPAVLQCSACGSWDADWVDVPIAGTVFTWTRTHHDFPGTEGLEKPFVTLVVSIGDTPAQLMGVLEGPQDGLSIGSPVVGRIINHANTNKGRPAFRWQLASVT